MCTCLKSNHLLHWGGREFINISGGMWCQYNINSTSWGTLLNWAMFLLSPDYPCRTESPSPRDIHMWVFVGHKDLIRSLDLKMCAVLSSKTVFLARSQAWCAASFGVLVCSAESWRFFFFREDPKFCSTWVKIAWSLWLQGAFKFFKFSSLFKF